MVMMVERITTNFLQQMHKQRDSKTGFPKLIKVVCGDFVIRWRTCPTSHNISFHQAVSTSRGNVNGFKHTHTHTHKRQKEISICWLVYLTMMTIFLFFKTRKKKVFYLHNKLFHPTLLRFFVGCLLAASNNSLDLSGRESECLGILKKRDDNENM